MLYRRKKKAVTDDARGLQVEIGRALGSFTRRRSAMRFAAGIALTLIAIWSLVAAYVVLMPATFASNWTLILPGSGSSVSVSLDSIGQASSAPSNQFSSSSISPKVIYKEIALSDQVRNRAAQIMDMTPRVFGAPRIKLIEETSLLLLEIRARTPEQAQKKAQALQQAFDEQLDKLRRDELAQRSTAVMENLKGYRAQVELTRGRILDARRASGLVSVNHYNDLANNVALARRRLVELKVDTERIANEQAMLVQRVGVGAKQAGLALRLAGNPEFAKLAGDFSEANAAFQADVRRLGPANPVLINAARKRSAILDQMITIAAPLTGGDVEDIEPIALLLNNSYRAELLRNIVSGEAALEGKRNEIRSLESEIGGMQTEVRSMSEAAAQLEDLRKDQIVAEAVLTSAIARLDTSKSDLYGSYPLVQTLAAPDLASSPSQPATAMAIVGGIAGSFLALFAWWLAWRQHKSNRARLKST